MKKTISIVALASLFAAGSAMASGYRIPEQSVDSTAKSGASIASTDSADAAYYNPAAMSRLDDRWQVEGNATYLHLTAIEYEDRFAPQLNGESETENFLLPAIFVVSPDYNNFRFGFSVTAPYGLQKRWNDPFPRATAEKFSLKVFDINPTVSYKINDMFSIAGGVRILYNDATVSTNGAAFGQNSMYMSGDSVEWGYNLALDAQVTEDLIVALTYRSNVDLDLEGDVEIYPAAGGVLLDGDGVTVPAPAVLSLSTAYTVNQWTFDLTLDQTFWSEYEALTFDYDKLPDLTLPKDWDDTFAIRLGVDYVVNEALTLMGGIAYDENPVPEEHIGFELPDSDAWLFSFGGKYNVNEDLEVGMAVLYDYKEEREVTTSTIKGEFTNASAILISLGLNYKF